MDKDTTPPKYPNTKYDNANDLRLFTGDGLTTGAMVNIKGTETLIDLPVLMKLSLASAGIGGTINAGSITITDENGNNYVNTFTFNFLGSVEESLASLAEQLPNGFPGITLVVHNTENNGLFVYSNDIQITVWSDNTNSSQNLFTADIYNNPVVIGDTTLRDELILFTTENSSDIGGFGQIWKVAYDDATLETTTGLIYAGDLNFSMEHLIEAVARYETPAIQRIHWTDDYNVLRSVEITNPDRFTIPVDKIAATPSVILSMPKIESIVDGVLEEGTYQIAYRLTTSEGKTTEVSPWSTPVNINNMPETVNEWDYGRNKDFNLLGPEDEFTPKFIAEKGLTASIDDIPLGYESIEVFALKKDQNIGIITSIDVYPLAGATSKNITYLGNEDSATLVKQSEIDNFNITFQRVKTLAIKDNHLLVGNVKEYEIPDTYDTNVFRYRFNSSTGHTDINNPYLPNPYNRDETINGNANNVYNRQKNSNILGGSGKNISYKFVQQELEVDYRQNNSADPHLKTTNPLISSRNIGKITLKRTVNGVSDDLEYNAGGLKQNYQNPYLEHRLAGYQRSEIYRFGIVFYDLTGRPSDVRWIGDIRMPEDSDSDDNYDSFSAFTYNAITDTTLKAYPLGLEFTVDINEIKNNITGFSIVRAPRRNKDKTILGQGLLHDTAYSEVEWETNDEGGTYPNKGIRNIDRINTDYPKDGGGGGSIPLILQTGNVSRDPGSQTPFSEMTNNMDISNKLFTFDSPQLMSSVGNPNDYGEVITGSGISAKYEAKNLQLRPISRNSSSINNLNTEVANQLNILNEDPIFDPTINNLSDPEIAGFKIESKRDYVKYYPGILDQYEYNNIANSEINNNIKIPFSNARKVGAGQAVDLAQLTDGAPGYAGKSYYNTHHAKVTHCCPTILIHGDKDLEELYNLDSSGLPNNIVINDPAYLVNTTAGKIKANIYYDNKEAYGGTNKQDIESTEYISVGHFQPVRPTDTETTYTADVYGGDTYLNLVPIPKTFSLINDLNETAGMGEDPKEFTPAITNPVFSPSKRIYSEARHWAGYYVPIESTENVDVRLMQGWGGPQYRNKNNYDENTDWDSLQNQNNYGNRIDPFIPKTSSLQDTTSTYVGDALPSSYASPEYFLPNIRNGEVDVTNYQSEDFSKTYFPISSNLARVSEFDNRIYASDPKINGEFVDSWGQFKAANYLDVDGHHGPLNKLETLNDNVIFLQDKGFGLVAVNPRSVITGADGIELQLGSGTVLQDHQYVSTEIGSRHQFGTIKSPRAFYFFDSNSRKFYRFTGKADPLSDLKSMSAYFYNQLSGPILNSDNPVIRSGINCGFDPRYNEILFTYHDGNTEVSDTSDGLFTKVAPIVDGVSTTNTYTFDIDDTTAGKLLSGAKLYIKDYSDATSGPTAVGGTSTGPLDNYILANVLSVLPILPVPTSGLTIRVTLTVDLPVFNAGEPLERNLNYKIESFVPEREATVVYSENIDAFAGFYSFTPKSYINDSARYFSPSPDSPRELHVHNEGERGVFYDRDPSVSSIRLIVNPQGDFTKVFNTIEYLGQMKDTDGNDIVNETFDTIRVYNEYQDTGEVPLVNLENIKRRMRTWRTNVPRSGTEFARIRNPYTTIELSFTNNLNKEIITNDIVTYYLDIPM